MHPEQNSLPIGKTLARIFLQIVQYHFCIILYVLYVLYVLMVFFNFLRQTDFTNLVFGISPSIYKGYLTTGVNDTNGQKLPKLSPGSRLSCIYFRGKSLANRRICEICKLGGAQALSHYCRIRLTKQLSRNVLRGVTLSVYTIKKLKKLFDIPVLSRDVTYQTLPRPGIMTSYINYSCSGRIW